MPKYYLGVDGGGTNCRIRLADEFRTNIDPWIAAGHAQASTRPVVG